MTLAEKEERLKAKILETLEMRKADVRRFSFAGLAGLVLRQVLREWRDGRYARWNCELTPPRTRGVCGRPFICDQDHFSRYPGCEPLATPRPPLLPVRGPVAAQPL